VRPLLYRCFLELTRKERVARLEHADTGTLRGLFGLTGSWQAIALSVKIRLTRLIVVCDSTD